MLGNDEASIKDWIINRYGSVEARIATEIMPFFWIGDPPVPRDYPKSATELRTMIRGSDAHAMLDDIVAARPENIVSVLGFATLNGPALAGVMLTAPQAVSHGAKDPLTKGFRPDATPKSVLATRYYGGAKLTRTAITRADPAWVHGRGLDQRVFKLREKTVVMVGCGSVGAPVAISLAQAGVGRLVLVDQDSLKWANVGRHPIGASGVGKPKALALAQKLRHDLPHMTVEYYATDLEANLQTRPQIFDTADLIVAATGSWAADSLLDAWHGAVGRHVPIVYAWTEAHACAGHGVLICDDASLRAGFDTTGLPHLRVTTWPAEGPHQQEPACGAVYQPYGPVELGFINALVADLALDALLTNPVISMHRIWMTSRKRIAGLGGKWSADWEAVAGDHSQGGQIIERDWPSVIENRAGEAAAA